MAQESTQPEPGLEDIQPHVFRPEERLGVHMLPQKPTIPSVPGPLAIISDIHANLEALTAVLADIDARGIKRIICLGDVVGYGPNPLECIDLVSTRCEFSLMGNHDFAIFFEPFNFNTAAENAAFWTRQQFENDPDISRRNRRWKYLGSMPTRMSNERFVCFHGSPRKPINEYVFPDDIYTAPTKMAAIFDRFEHLCFVGHTHVPGVFIPDPDFYSPEELNNRYTITDERAMINVGSVGQPRDRNPDASYVILHDASDGAPDASGGGAATANASGGPSIPGDPGGFVEFIRLPYDVQKTVNKVRAIDALDNFLGARLLDGR
ncbi:MAG TPA: metallophosphoesterase family protein [Phycisphaerae bacterium]|nr:metallophosphoesterase family protein [Phycisphaerae bacterium]